MARSRTAAIHRNVDLDVTPALRKTRIETVAPRVIDDLIAECSPEMETTLPIGALTSWRRSIREQLLAELAGGAAPGSPLEMAQGIATAHAEANAALLRQLEDARKGDGVLIREVLARVLDAATAASTSQGKTTLELAALRRAIGFLLIDVDNMGPRLRAQAAARAA